MEALYKDHLGRPRTIAGQKRPKVRGQGGKKGGRTTQHGFPKKGGRADPHKLTSLVLAAALAQVHPRVLICDSRPASDVLIGNGCRVGAVKITVGTMRSFPTPLACLLPEPSALGSAVHF